VCTDKLTGLSSISLLQFAAAAGMATWNLLEIAVSGTKWFNGRITAVGAACGVVAGLVGITPSAGFVTPMASIAIGAITAVGIYWVPKLVKIVKIDDRLDAFAFHGVGGIIGSLLTGLFANKEVNSGGVDGAFYGTGELLGKQIVAILVTTVISVVGTTVIYWMIPCMR
jgi:Amt family ammonium transporter